MSTLRKRKFAESDTPSTAKTAHTAHANLCTDGTRRLFLNDLQEEVVQVELDVFFDHGLLPDLRDDIDVEQVLRKLRQVQPPVLLPSREWGRLDKTSVFSEEEYRSHSKLTNIINAIAATTGIPSSERTLIFHCSPTEASVSATHDSSTWPGCIGVLADAPAGRNEWADIAVPIHFRTTNGVHETGEVGKFPISYRPQRVPMLTPMTLESKRAVVVNGPHRAGRC